MSRPRPYQLQLKGAVYAEWNAGCRVVVASLATGGGKTVIVGDIIKELAVPTCAIAHRQELVGQISLALAREGVRHSIIAPQATVRAIVSLHMAKLGRSFYDPSSNVRVAGVDTLVRLKQANDPWFHSVRLVVIDEGHHVLKENKWGRAFAMFPQTALGLLPTATPARADGRGLGRAAGPLPDGGDGIADAMVHGPSMRALIDMGYLTDYRVVCPPQAVNLSDVHVSDATGDFNAHEVRAAVHRSPRLVGDVVREYLRFAAGKLGVTFAVDVSSATEIAAAYRAAGVTAEVVSAKTPDDLRRSILARFEAREVMQLVNVDLFGEGFDLPAIEVVSMARPTQSYPLFAQQFGRALRLMLSATVAAGWDAHTDAGRRALIAASSKPRAIVIDHVGNIERHNLPDRLREWSLDRREKRSRGGSTDAIPLRTCLNPVCFSAYERIHKVCPYCGHYPEPSDRGGIRQVDGDLTELDDETLRAMRGEVIDLDAPAVVPYGAPPEVIGSIQRKHWEKLQSQRALRHGIASWAGVHHDDDSTNYRRFFHTFGLSVLDALALKRKDADALLERIAGRLAVDGYVIPPQTAPMPPAEVAL